MNRKAIIRAALKGLRVRTPRDLRELERGMPVPLNDFWLAFEHRELINAEIDAVYEELGGEG